MKVFRRFWWLVLVSLFPACQEREKLTPLPETLELRAPAALGGAPIPHPERNPFTEAGMELGKALFFDPILSGNNQVSCATCHLPQKAFTDGMALGNLGVSGKPLLRHSPTLVNLAWADQGLFWDGGARDLESLSFAPLQHADEMAQDLGELLEELEAAGYQPQFKAAFGKDTLHSALVVRAIAQFQRTLVSANSKYDRVMQGSREESFTPLEETGRVLFEQKCGSCHTPPFFTDHDFHNNGLDATFPTELEHPGQGRYRVTLNPADLGKFKTPTLRNVMVTSPYMHDGRLATIKEVMDHYDHSMQYSPTLDAVFLAEEGQVIGIPLTTAEKEALTAFLHTLTDREFVGKKERE